MKHLQLYRNQNAFSTRQLALDKWKEADFLATLQDGEFIVARYKEGDETYVMTGHYVQSVGKVVVHDIALLESEIDTVGNKVDTLTSEVSANTANISANTAEIAELNTKIDGINGAISGDFTELINDINTVSGDVATLTQAVEDNEQVVATSLSQLNTSCGFDVNMEYVAGPNYISGATSVTDALNILSESLQNKVSYDALKHSITIDGVEQTLNVGQLLTDMEYDADNNILTLHYKDENDGSGNTAVDIDMTSLVNDAVSTAVTNAELIFTNDDTHNVTFTKTGNTVMADVDTYDCGEY